MQIWYQLRDATFANSSKGFGPFVCVMSFNFDKDCNVAHKSLGMKWVPNEDVIVFSIDLEVREFTRRGILSPIY